ncbi:MAG TPA: HD domain-containing protein [Azoarcus taiwanensis]|nr:HD domain-containing protein [Azoarcus taiwanensis]
MNEFRTPAQLPSHDLVRDRLPRIFRIQSITRLPADGRLVMNRAVLFHERASLSVEWASRHVDVRLKAGCLVSVCWLGRPVSTNGAICIARLVRLDRPEPSINLFDTLPTSWVIERGLVKRAAALWEGLPRPFAHLFNAIFWDGQRLHRYLTGPSSLGGHHPERLGNLRHSIEVAERALDIAAREARVHRGVLVMAALLHDAGKADEYRLGASRHELTDRGRLIGHKMTVFEWIAVARAKHRVILPEAHYLGLIHALTSAKGAPPWLGIREPQSLEASILSAADRLSGQSDLIEQHAPRRSGFGRYHPHLKGSPFVLAQSG